MTAPDARANQLIDDIARIAAEVRQSVLQEFGETRDKCDFAADEVASRLRDRYIQASLVKGAFLVDYACADELEPGGERHLMRHVWVRADGTIVDATADQFNDLLRQPMPAIFIGKCARYQRGRIIEATGMMRNLRRWDV